MLRAPRSHRTPWFLVVALCCLMTTVACGPSDPLEDILRRQASGDYLGSLEDLRELLEERPDDPEVLFVYGRTLVAVGQTSLAEWSLRKAMEDPEWMVPAGLQLALGALGTQNYPEAIEVTTRLLEEHPENVQALLLRANAHAHSKLDPEAALADVERIYELDPANLEAMEPRILALLTLEDEEGAAEAIEELGRRIDEAALGEGVPGWHCATTAIFALESGDIELANERWEKCLELHPAHGNVVSNAVKFYDGQGRLDRSLEILRRAHSEMPESRDLRLALSARLTAHGEVAEAEALLREATETGNLPIAASAWLDLAKHQQVQEQFGAAAESVGKAVDIARELDDPSPQLLFEYADALVLAGEFERALEVVDEAGLPAYQAMIRARVAQDRGEFAEAIGHFEEAFRLWPDNVWARYMAALAAEAIGDFDRAIDLYRYAIRISAGDTDARVRVARIHLAEGRPADALTLLRTRASELPLDLEGELLSVYAWSMSGETGMANRMLEMFRRGNPENFGRALELAAAGTARRLGPGAAERQLRKWSEEDTVDFTDASHREPLRALVEHGSAAGRGEAALETVRAAVAASPKDAAVHAVLGLALERTGAPAPEIRAAYERALALDAEQPDALAGLGRIALADDPAAALAYFDRAAAAAPDADEAVLGAAQALAALDRRSEAERRLEALLEDDPVNGEAAAALADLRIERGETDDRTLDLARRAVRFGGGSEAHDRLSRVHAARGETDLASAEAKRAEELREPADG